jgi:hypothetical protein
MINPEQFYSGMQAQKILGIKSRQYIAKYITEKSLRAIETEGKEGKRYMIKGSDLIDFKERYDRGVVKGERYTISALKLMLKDTLEYCEEHGIKTLAELINHKKEL